jgi:hypothetical protein
VTLTPAEHIVMDLLADHPDWTNDELAGAMPRKRNGGQPTSYWVNQLLRKAFGKYGVVTRTGAVVAHLADRRRRRVKGKAETVDMGL